MALGTEMSANCAIIRKNRMSIAYSMMAEMEPICIACTPTRLAPSHMTSDSTAFIRKNARVSVAAKTMFTRMALSA